MTEFALNILMSLADGEWHELDTKNHPNMTLRVRPLYRAGLIHYHSAGHNAQAIATDAGLAYLKQLNSPPHPTQTDT